MATQTFDKQHPQYAKELEKCIQFLTEFRKDGMAVYRDQLQLIANREQKSIDIYIDDIIKSEIGSDEEFAEHIQSNTLRYVSMFSEAVDTRLPNPTVPLDANDVIDVLHMHRQATNQPAQPQSQNADEPEDLSSERLPMELKRRYELRILPRADQKQLKLREVRASQIGSLVLIRGIITRAAEVKPLITVATYTCDKCGYEIYQTVTSRTFMPVIQCPRPVCSKAKPPGVLHMQTRGSKFVKFQELRVQELAHEVPTGHIPRAMSIHVRGDLTRECSPGDICTVTGVFLPTPYTGLKGLKAGLIADTYMEAMRLVRHKKSYSDYILTEELVERIEEMATTPDLYSRLAKSIAPEIYGHEDVKKALLLMMVGGITRCMQDGMKIRGDINMCMVGDPGVAKSQLLKYISTVSPRGIYTSGKGSSGVGLTAAVVKDPMTRDFVLEGGSLVLADMGVCCIDEFDKMEEGDRTAIHEVMEQQTISIAKAGITTTLNARTAILAAANPAYGRYNPHRTPAENINLPPALLSRFDILFVILDKPDMEHDLRLAQHITYVHTNRRAPDLDFDPIDPDFMRSFVAQARRLEPFLPKELTEHVVAAYVNMRSEEQIAAEDATTYTTARTLLSILRLSQALARLRLASEVSGDDIDEAMRLMAASKESLAEDQQRKRGLDPVSSIYIIIRDYAKARDIDAVSYDDILPRVVAKGHSQQQLTQCLEEYENLNVWQMNQAKTEIRFV